MFDNLVCTNHPRKVELGGRKLVAGEVARDSMSLDSLCVHCKIKFLSWSVSITRSGRCGDIPDAPAAGTVQRVGATAERISCKARRTQIRGGICLYGAGTAEVGVGESLISLRQGLGTLHVEQRRLRHGQARGGLVSLKHSFLSLWGEWLRTETRDQDVCLREALSVRRCLRT